jgi:hypothetical protein
MLLAAGVDPCAKHKPDKVLGMAPTANVVSLLHAHGIGEANPHKHFGPPAP